MKIAVVLGGDVVLADREFAKDADVVIAADSGLDAAMELDLVVNVVVGDMDSVDPENLRKVESTAHVVSFPRDKDFTDFELALEEVDKFDTQELVLLGTLGGRRVDHELANLAAIAHPKRRHIRRYAVSGPTRVDIIDSKRLASTAGRESSFSLVPFGGPAKGVTVTGLKWSLQKATLDQFRATAVSNEIIESEVTVSVTEGVLLAIRPGFG